jgi:acetyl esterase/lipase
MSARPDLDPELGALLAAMPEMPPLAADTLAAIRPYATVPAETALAGRDVDRRDVVVTAHDGAAIGLTILNPSGIDRDVAAPCIYWIHGGGMVMGDRFSQIDIPLDWLDQLGAVVVTVDYRLAPEVTGPTPVEDCYAGLAWVAANADALGIDPARLVVAGTSAGGGLAAGVTLLARDRSGPAIAAQVLVCPMLDHRNTTVSSHQYSGPGIWSREANAFGWSALLGETGGEVSCYVSPALADDLSGLPATFIDVGSAEVFRDEVVTQAARIWEAGGQAELHVWSGGCHGFDTLFPEIRLSAAARRTRTEWLERALCPPRA